jgi:glutathione synthase/RimK-type ligase-like ATP-grasp enzyme
VDYRYAYQNGEHEELEPMSLSNDLADRCLRLASVFGLEFAGIDLKITDEGKAYCLEVNPAPAFSYYELHTGQEISSAVAEYLAGDG